MRHIGPLVEERSEQEARYGKVWAEKPVGTLNRFLMMALNLSQTERCSVLARRDFEREGTDFRRDNKIRTFYQLRGYPHHDNGT